ncbi:MAG: carbohydrate-binding domain-containing protein [Bacteroidales bacterium]|nr:carbohydrate-binding domain-containing protein [Bacteroidales bacterium]
MKKAVIFLLAAGTVLAGCSKEDIIPTSSNSSTSSSTPATDTGSFDNDEDDYGAVNFDRTISIVWSGSGASVSGDANNVVSISGANVTVNNTGTAEKVKYELSGSSSNGSLKLYSNNKQALVFNNLSLTNPSGAAINNQGKKRCFIVLEGTSSLADGSSASYGATGEEDLKAVFFSEGQLIFSGEGSLTVTANKSQGKAGITSDDYVRITGSPSIKITAGSSAGHGLRGKDAVAVDGGTLDVSVSAAMKKGITSDSLVVFNGGVTTVKASGGTAYDSEDADYKASAGIKADKVFKINDGTLTVSNSGQGGKGITGDAVAYFNGGTVNVTVTGSNYGSSSSGGGFGPRATTTDSSKSAKAIKFDGDIHFGGATVNASATSHEAIESKGAMDITAGSVYGYSAYDDGINSAGDLTISGGYACAWTDGTKTGADGFDANGNIYIKGGVSYGVCIHGGADVGFDANSEARKQLIITGGTIIAVGGFESGYSMTGSAYQGTCPASSWVGVSDIIGFKMPSSSTTVAFYNSGSQPTVTSGVATSGGSEIWDGKGYIPGTLSGGTAVSLSTYSGGSGMGGGQPGGGFGPGGRP